MDIRHLRQVLAIREHGSFAKAAEALNMAQPALSKSIAKLEDELRLTIFTRTSIGSELTPMGEMIAARAERVMAATRDLSRDAALIAGGDAGVVRLGASSVLGDTLVPRLLIRLAEAHPRLRLSVEFGTSNRLLPLVESREIDLVICSAARESPLAYVEAMQSAVIFACAPTHPLASERQTSIARFAKFPCAGAYTPRYSASMFLGRPEDADTLDAYVADDYRAVMPLVHAGHATLLAPLFFVQEALAAGDLVRLNVDWSGSISFGCHMTQAASYSPVLAEITRHCIDLGDEILRSLPDLALPDGVS